MPFIGTGSVICQILSRKAICTKQICRGSKVTQGDLDPACSCPLHLSVIDPLRRRIYNFSDIMRRGCVMSWSQGLKVFSILGLTLILAGFSQSQNAVKSLEPKTDKPDKNQ